MESTSMNRRCIRAIFLSLSCFRVLAILLIERKHAHVHALKRNNNHTANRFAICERSEQNGIQYDSSTLDTIRDHRCEYILCVFVGPDLQSEKKFVINVNHYAQLRCASELIIVQELTSAQRKKRRGQDTHENEMSRKKNVVNQSIKLLTAIDDKPIRSPHTLTIENWKRN